MVVRFQELDGRRVAVVLQERAREWVLRGLATLDSDEVLGPVLRIQVDDQLGTVFALQESSWSGRIEPGDAECEFRVIIPLKSS